MARHTILISFFISLLSFSAAAANNQNNQKPVPALSAPQPSQALEFQLKTQELQLEQQLLQVKQQLLHIQQANFSQQPTQQPSSIDLQWTAASNGAVPKNAVIAANAADKPLYICRSDYQAGVHPGQITDKGCLITYGGRVIVQANYQVLTGNYPVAWKPKMAIMRFPSMPFPGMPSPRLIVAPQGPHWRFPVEFSGQDIPVPGGNEPVNNENARALYICRAMLGYQIHLGKVVSNNCNVADQGKETPVSTYEVLFAKGPN